MRIAALFLAFAGACFAQLDDNTITITALRSVALQPDQAVLTISLDLPMTSSFDDALAAVPGVTLTAADLAGVQTFGPLLSWQFSKAITLSDLGTALPALIAAQQKLAAQPDGSDLHYYLNSQASQQAQQANACPWPTLFSDAQAQAQKVAQAAGVAADGVVSMSQGNGTSAILPFFRVGDFSAIYDPTAAQQSVTSLLLTTSRPGGPSCSLTVQFQLTH
ncbi:MAG TPA: hypothetical protein VKX45_13930 [Bryobacteraceae bacterium]|jgi:uncharacterized protein YggE|nr:hypothetical protein [Bryobacteraceae bacterium]